MTPRPSGLSHVLIGGPKTVPGVGSGRGEQLPPVQERAKYLAQGRLGGQKRPTRRDL